MVRCMTRGSDPYRWWQPGRRPAGRVALFAVVAAVAALATPALGAFGPHSRSTARFADPAASHRWNVVFIVGDDENIQGNAVMGNVRRLLADHGVSFNDFHVTTSQCGPSRASILTGLYSHSSGVTDNFGPHGYPAFDQTSNLAVWLKNAGYRTALVGKFLNDYSLDGAQPIPPGWDDWQAMDSVPLEEVLRLHAERERPASPLRPGRGDYSTTVLTAKALGFLRRVQQPFFLYFAPVTPAPAGDSRTRPTSAVSTSWRRSRRRR